MPQVVQVLALALVLAVALVLALVLVVQGVLGRCLEGVVGVVVCP